MFGHMNAINVNFPLGGQKGGGGGRIHRTREQSFLIVSIQALEFPSSSSLTVCKNGGERPCLFYHANVSLSRQRWVVVCHQRACCLHPEERVSFPLHQHPEDLRMRLCSNYIGFLLRVASQMKHDQIYMSHTHSRF